MAKHGKNFRAALAKVDATKVYNLIDGVGLVKEASFAKFDETIDVAIALNLKKSHTVRDTVVLPNQFGGEKKIAVFAKGDKAKDAEEAGAFIVGDVELVEKIQQGWMDFDVCIATPDMMKDVGKLGPVLGRRGLMPNPKTGTVTMDVKGAIAELKKGRVEFRANKENVVHLGIAKLSMNNDAILGNVKAFVNAVEKKKPSDLKGEYIRSITVSSTMGPGVKITHKENER